MRIVSVLVAMINEQPSCSLLRDERWREEAADEDGVEGRDERCSVTVDPIECDEISMRTRAAEASSAGDELTAGGRYQGVRLSRRQHHILDILQILCCLFRCVRMALLLE